MIGRLVQSADFQRLLATPMRSRSAHFAVINQLPRVRLRAEDVEALSGPSMSEVRRVIIDQNCHRKTPI